MHLFKVATRKRHFPVISNHKAQKSLYRFKMLMKMRYGPKGLCDKTKSKWIRARMRILGIVRIWIVLKNDRTSNAGRAASLVSFISIICLLTKLQCVFIKYTADSNSCSNQSRHWNDRNSDWGRTRRKSYQRGDTRNSRLTSLKRKDPQIFQLSY